MKGDPISAMIDSVQATIAHLVRLRRPVARLIQPGLPRAAIGKRAAVLPFPLRPDLVALYGFKNGTAAKLGASIDDLWFFPGFIWLSLEAAIEEYRGRQRSRRWRRSWFPVFADGAGGYLVVSCDPADGPGVVGFETGEPESEVEYVSLAAMFETLATCFAEGAFFVDSKKGFEIDDDKHRRVAIRLNPSLDFWTQEEGAAAERRRQEEAAELAKEAARLLKNPSPKIRRAREAKLSLKHRVALAASSAARFNECLASDPESLRKAIAREPPAPDAGLAQDLLGLADRISKHVMASPAARSEAHTRHLELAGVALDAAAARGAPAKELADHQLVVYSLQGRFGECVPLLRVEGSSAYTTFAVSIALAQATLASHGELLAACLQQATSHPELLKSPVTLANVLSHLLGSNRAAEAAELARTHLQHDLATPALYSNAAFAFAGADDTGKVADYTIKRIEALLGRDSGAYFRDAGSGSGDVRGTAHLALGLWYGRKMDVANVIRHFKAARTLKCAALSLQKNHPALLGLANRSEVQAFFTSETDAALATLNRQIRANAKDWFAVFSRGLLRHERGEIDKALVDYRRTIDLNPSYPDVYVNIGNIHWSRDKNFAEAVRWYDEAIDRAKDHLLGRLNRAEAKLYLGDAAGALVDAVRGISIEKRDPRAHFLAGLAHLALGDRAAARKASRAGMALDRSLRAIDRDDWKAQLRTVARP